MARAFLPPERKRVLLGVKVLPDVLGALDFLVAQQGIKKSDAVAEAILTAAAAAGYLIQEPVPEVKEVEWCGEWE